MNTSTIIVNIKKPRKTLSTKGITLGITNVPFIFVDPVNSERLYKQDMKKFSII
jgi:hypothetical protein